MLTRINVLLAGLLVLCALGLVTSQHRARKVFVDVERAQSHAAAHEVRWNQLQVEQTELAKAGLIDLRARRELAMQSVAAERTLHLSIDPVTRQVSLSQPWREPANGRKPTGVRAAAAQLGPRPAAAQAGTRAAAAQAGTRPAAAVQRTSANRLAEPSRESPPVSSARPSGPAKSPARPGPAGAEPSR